MPAARLQRISRTLEANSYTSPHPQHACVASPELHTSTHPTRPYTRSTPASHLHNSLRQAPTRLYTPQHTCVALRKLHTSTRSTRSHACNTLAAHLQNSISVRILDVPTPAARLRRIPITPHIYASYTFLRLPRISRTPYLYASYASSPAARLQRISIIPYLYASYTSLHQQQPCIASPKLNTSMHPTHPYTCSTPAAHLHNSAPLRILHVPTPAVRLHRISRALEARRQHACGASPDLQGP